MLSGAPLLLWRKGQSPAGPSSFLPRPLPGHVAKKAQPRGFFFFFLLPCPSLVRPSFPPPAFSSEVMYQGVNAVVEADGTRPSISQRSLPPKDKTQIVAAKNKNKMRKDTTQNLTRQKAGSYWRESPTGRDGGESKGGGVRKLSASPSESATRKKWHSIEEKKKSPFTAPVIFPYLV